MISAYLLLRKVLTIFVAFSLTLVMLISFFISGNKVCEGFLGNFHQLQKHLKLCLLVISPYRKYKLRFR